MKSVNYILFATLVALLQIAQQCSEFTFPVADNTVMTVRTMDFPVPMGTKIVVVPIGTYFESQSPSYDNLGITWVTTVGYVSFSALGENTTTDGMNSCGLSCAYLSLFETIYENPNTTNKTPIGISILCDYILGQFCSVDDVKANLTNLCIYQDILFYDIPTILVHVSIRDEDGKAIVLEFLQGEQVYHDNLVGILTNDPTYDWHIKNIQNYNYVNNITPSGTIIINNFKYDAFSDSYAVSNYGMSSDDSPVSRFVRAAMTIRFMTIPKNSNDALMTGYHLLSKVEVVPGTTILIDSKGKPLIDKTIYKFVKNQSERRIYYATYFDPTLRMVDLNSIDFTKPYNSFEQVWIVNKDNVRYDNITSDLFA